MTSVLKGLLLGAAAGAAGTTALNTVTYADMLVRARPASGVPAAVTAAVARRAGVDVPGRHGERAVRLEASGRLAGIGVGVVVGAIAGGVRAAGLRLPAAIAGPLLGAAAMAATDVPAARLRVSDPGRWSPADRAADALPHLAYGAVTTGVLGAAVRGGATEREYRQQAATLRAPTAGLLLRATVLGAATGARSSAGMTVVALRSRPADAGPAGRLARRGGRAVLSVLAATELVLDKYPSIPSRLSRQGIVPRIALSAAAGATVARRDGFRGGAAAVAAAAGSWGAALLGHRLRAAADRSKRSSLPVALLEDAAASVLAWTGAGRTGTRT